MKKVAPAKKKESKKEIRARVEKVLHQAAKKLGVLHSTGKIDKAVRNAAKAVAAKIAHDRKKLPGKKKRVAA